MRTIDPGVITAMSASTRRFAAKMTHRRVIPSFTQKAITEGSTVLGGITSHDVDAYGTGFLRVANVGGALYYQYVSNPDGTWPAWSSASISLTAGSSVGLLGSRIWYQGGNGYLYYADFNGTSFGTPVQISTSFSAKVCYFAPVLSTVCYMIYWDEKQSGGQTDVYQGSLIKVTTGGTVGTVWKYYQPDITGFRFDAVNYVNGDVLYFHFPDEGKTYVQTGHYANVLMGEIKDIILPVDVSDNTCMLALGGVSVINGKPWVSAMVRRPSGTAFQGYFIGPHYSFGRDSFITEYNADSEVVQESGYAVPKWSGKIINLSSKIWFVGVGMAFYSPQTELTGYSDAGTQISGFNKVGISFEPGTANRFSAELAVSQSLPTLSVEDEIQIEVGFDDSGYKYGDIGRFGIDGFVKDIQENGAVYSLVGRSAGLRKMSRWVSDTDFDYWSQERQSSSLEQMDTVVRTLGYWDEGPVNGIVLKDLNEPGILYASGRVSRNGIVRGMFNYPGNAYFTPNYGVGLQYHRETSIEASTRTGIDIEDVDEDTNGHYGLIAMFTPTAHSGSPGIGLYAMIPWSAATSEGFGFVPITSWALSIPADTDHWLMMQFHEGYIRVLYRLDSSTTWTLLGSTSYTYYNSWFPTPWKAGNGGRGFVYVKNVTPNAYVYGGLESTEDTIAAGGGVSSLPASGTLLIDNEQITYNGVDSGGDPLQWVGNKDVVDGMVGVNAPHDNSYTGPFDGYPVWVDYENVEVSHDYLDGHALVGTSGPGAGRVFRITDFDWTAPYQWIPNSGQPPLYDYELPDKWEDHVDDPAHGSYVDEHWCRIFTDINRKDPASAFNKDSRVGIASAIYVTGRGVNGTSATSHSSGTRISYYIDASINVLQLDYLTADMDMSLEWMLAEICGKAGVEASFEQKYYGSTSHTHSDWDIVNDVAAIGDSPSDGAILRLKITAGSEAGVFCGSATGTPSGRIVSMTSGYINFYDVEVGGTIVLIDKVPVIMNFTRYFDISVDKYGWCSVWQDGMLLAGYKVGSGGNSVGIVSNGNASFDIIWPEFDDRVDNFILDIGQNGFRFLTELIGERVVYVNEQADKSLYFFRNRTTVNASSPYTLSYVTDETDVGVNVFTRLRLEGGEVVETADYNMMKQYGNLFATRQSRELDSHYELLAEADRQLAEMKLSLLETSFSGVLDPRLQPNDVYRITVPGIGRASTRNIIVDRLNYIIDINEDEARVDMEVVGRDE